MHCSIVRRVTEPSNVHESNAHSTVFYCNFKKNKSVIITTTVLVCVYFESAENTPNMNILLLSKKQLSTEVLEAGIIAGWHDTKWATSHLHLK